MTSKKKTRTNQEQTKNKQTKPSKKIQKTDNNFLVPTAEQILKAKSYLEDKFRFNECLRTINSQKWMEYPLEEKEYLLHLAEDLILKNGKGMLIDFNDKLEWGILFGELYMIEAILKKKDEIAEHIDMRDRPTTTKKSRLIFAGSDDQEVIDTDDGWED